MILMEQMSLHVMSRRRIVICGLVDLCHVFLPSASSTPNHAACTTDSILDLIVPAYSTKRTFLSAFYPQECSIRTQATMVRTIMIIVHVKPTQPTARLWLITQRQQNMKPNNMRKVMINAIGILTTKAIAILSDHLLLPIPPSLHFLYPSLPRLNASST